MKTVLLPVAISLLFGVTVSSAQTNSGCPYDKGLPPMTIEHYNTAKPDDVARVVLWAAVWTFCLIRLKAKQKWLFR